MGFLGNDVPFKRVFADDGSISPLRMGIGYQIMLLICTVLVAYYPSGFAELCSVDDRKIVGSFASLASWSFRDIFIPGVHDGYYYRPFVMLSFIVDRYLFDLAPNMLHLENVVFHGINTVLVYWLAHQLVPFEKKGTSLIPLAAALFFGLHPINTESVNWISGRTDLIAGFFVLVSANCLLLYRGRHVSYFLPCAVLALFFGFLSKEVALAFVPGGVVLLLARSVPAGQQSMDTTGEPRWRNRKMLLFALFGSGMVAFFFVLRSAAILTNEFRLGMTLRFIAGEPVYAALLFLRAFGFYMKKLLIPFPLNFAIVDADPLYDFLGIALAALCIRMAFRRSMPSVLILIGVLFIVPAFPIALGKVAWTPYAERYLYIPSAFIMLAVTFSAGELLKKIPRKYARAAWIPATVLLAIMMVGTFHRSTVWMHNITLLRDTVEKSPTVHTIRKDYAYALLEQGEYAQARLQFTLAKRYNQPKMLGVLSKLYGKELGSWEDADLGLAYVLEGEGKTAEALTAYEAVFEASQGQSVAALNRIVSLYHDRLLHTKSPREVRTIEKKLAIYAEKMYNSRGDPHLLYQLGKLALARGEDDRAVRYFGMAYDIFDEDDEFKLLSNKFIERIQRSPS